MSDTLYEEDFVTWTERQADALRQAGRAGSNLPIDFENLAEEVEDLGRDVRNKVESLVDRIIAHLLKLACSSAEQPRTKWRSEVDIFRLQLGKQLRDNHSLRAQLPAIVEAEFATGIRLAERNLADHGETADLEALGRWRGRGFSPEEILDDTFFPKAGDLPGRPGRT